MTNQSFIRRERLTWRLSQEELAALLGVSQAQVCRYETGEDQPTIPVLFGLEVIFGLPPRSFLPFLYAEVEDGVVTRAVPLERRVAEETGDAAETKVELLSRMMSRATSQPEA